MFSTCSATRADGTQCQNTATSKGMCPACFRRTSGRNGRFGLDPQYHDSYDEFRVRSKEFSLQDEAALIRTLIMRVIEGIEQRSESNFLNFVKEVFDKISAVLEFNHKMPKDQADAWAGVLTGVIRPAFSKHIGDVATITVKEAASITTMVSKLSKAMESWQKMEEQAVATVEIDVELIRYFLQKVIYPVITPAQRAIIAEHARNFSRGRVGGIETEGYPDEEGYYEADYEEPETAMVHVSDH